MAKDADERIVILIDGSNTYKKFRSIGIPPADMYVSYARLVSLLVAGRILVTAKYYIGITRNIQNTPEGARLVEGQKKFLAQLKRSGLEVVHGRIMYDEGVIREKGVDVKMAVDLVSGAADDTYDTALVVSSDTDLVPAFHYVKAKGKKIQYVTFGDIRSVTMEHVANNTRVITHTELVAHCCEFKK